MVARSRFPELEAVNQVRRDFSGIALQTNDHARRECTRQLRRRLEASASSEERIRDTLEHMLTSHEGHPFLVHTSMEDGNWLLIGFLRADKTSSAHFEGLVYRVVDESRSARAVEILDCTDGLRAESLRALFPEQFTPIREVHGRNPYDWPRTPALFFVKRFASQFRSTTLPFIERATRDGFPNIHGPLETLTAVWVLAHEKGHEDSPLANREFPWFWDESGLIVGGWGEAAADSRATLALRDELSGSLHLGALEYCCADRLFGFAIRAIKANRSPDYDVWAGQFLLLEVMVAGAVEYANGCFTFHDEWAEALRPVVARIERIEKQILDSMHVANAVVNGRKLIEGEMFARVLSNIKELGLAVEPVRYGRYQIPLIAAYREAFQSSQTALVANG